MIRSAMRRAIGTCSCVNADNREDMNANAATVRPPSRMGTRIAERNPSLTIACVPSSGLPVMSSAT